MLWEPRCRGAHSLFWNSSATTFSTQVFHPQYASLHCGSSDQMADQPLRLALYLHRPVFLRAVCNLIHASAKAHFFLLPSGMVARPRAQGNPPPLENLLDDVPAPISYIADFSFLRSFPEIVKFSHRALQAIRQLLPICSSFLSFFLEKNPFFLFFYLRRLCVFRRSFLFLHCLSFCLGFCFFYLLSFAASAALESISVFAMSLTSLFLHIRATRYLL